jgi:hypothetical protein
MGILDRSVRLGRAAMALVLQWAVFKKFARLSQPHIHDTAPRIKRLQRPAAPSLTPHFGPLEGIRMVGP